jgi:hypothetical protein
VSSRTLRSLRNNRPGLAVVALTILTALGSVPARGSDDTVLVRVSGGVGYTTGAGQPYKVVTGQQLLEDQYFAVTKPQAQAMLLLPDSSQVGLGSNTVIQVSAFQRAEGGDGSTIGIPQAGGTLRFNIKHPKGAHASYTFVTPSSNIAVRGTVGLLASSNGRDVVVCLDCSAHALSATVGGKTYELTTGQMLTISAKGVQRSSVTQSTLQMFSAAGLTTSATAAMPVLAATPANVPQIPSGTQQPGVIGPAPSTTNGVTTK